LALVGLIFGAAVTVSIALYALHIIATASSGGAQAAAAVVGSIDLAAITATFVYGSRGIGGRRQEVPPTELTATGSQAVG
jgi:hypothetical protein